MFSPLDPHITNTCEYSGLPGMAAYMEHPLSVEEKRQGGLSAEDTDRIIQMAWEDRTPFEAISIQYGLSEQDVIELMRREMRPSSFRMWRRRVSGRKTKHTALRQDRVNRFRSRNQKGG